MSTDTLISTGLGILVSVLLAVIGYRQTIGARQERVRHANEQAVQSALKLAFGEFAGDAAFVLNEIRKAIALEHRIPENLVWSERSLRAVAANRILSNDVLSQAEKMKTLARTLLLNEKGEFVGSPTEEAPETEGVDRYSRISFAVVALFSLAGGAAVATVAAVLMMNSLYKTGFGIDFEWLMLGSTAAITVLIIIFEVRRSLRMRRYPLADDLNPFGGHD